MIIINAKFAVSQFNLSFWKFFKYFDFKIACITSGPEKVERECHTTLKKKKARQNYNLIWYIIYKHWLHNNLIIFI